MWFMNHIYNPIVRWILQSPLHKWMSAGVLLIAFHGRKSGKEFITPVQYVRGDDSIWIMVGFPEKKNWWRNLTGGAPVRVCLEGKWQTGHAEAFSGKTDAGQVKLGLEAFIAHYPALKEHYAVIQQDAEKLQDAVFVHVSLN